MPTCHKAMAAGTDLQVQARGVRSSGSWAYRMTCSSIAVHVELYGKSPHPVACLLATSTAFTMRFVP